MHLGLVDMDCHTELQENVPTAALPLWEGQEIPPEPLSVSALALWKKKKAKSKMEPEVGRPLTRMCFSGRCHPRGRTISVAVCRQQEQLSPGVSPKVFMQSFSTSTGSRSLQARGYVSGAP